MKAIKGYHGRKESSLLNLNAINFYNFLSNKLRSRKSIPVMHDDDDEGLFVVGNEKVAGFLSEFKKVFTLDDGVLPSYKSYTNLCCDLNETNFAVDVVFKYLCKCNSQSAAGLDRLPGVF